MNRPGADPPPNGRELPPLTCRCGQKLGRLMQVGKLDRLVVANAEAEYFIVLAKVRCKKCRRWRSYAAGVRSLAPAAQV